MFAAFNKHADIVTLLLDHGADVNAANQLGQTALHLATVKGHTEVVEKLLVQQADVSIKDSAGWSPRQIAKYNKSKDINWIFF